MPKTPKERVYLSDEEKTILTGFLDEWNSKPNKKTRDSFVSGEVLQRIQEINFNKFGPDVISVDKVAKSLWEGRVKAVYTWFKNNKPYKDRAVFRLERKIPLRRVVAKLRAEELHDMVMEAAPGLEKGENGYPGQFQKSLSALMKGLTTEELSEMEHVREEWQTSGPPIDVRLNAAKKYSRKGIINAHQLLQKEMYVSCITFSFNPEVDTGVMAVVCHDYIASIHSKSHGKLFKTFREWNKKGYARIVEDMIGYANYVDQQRKEEMVPETVSEPLTFERGQGDLPLLPPETKGVKGMEISKNAQEILRAYFLRHYQLATGCESARTPWAVIGEDPSKFFDMACLPPAFKIQDPSRMGITVKSLLNHLRKRQDTLGERTFHFHHVIRNNKLEKSEYPESALRVLEGKPPSNGKVESDEPDAVPNRHPTLVPKLKGNGSKSPTKSPTKNKKLKIDPQLDIDQGECRMGDSMTSTRPTSIPKNGDTQANQLPPALPMPPTHNLQAWTTHSSPMPMITFPPLTLDPPTFPPHPFPHGDFVIPQPPPPGRYDQHAMARMLQCFFLNTQPPPDGEVYHMRQNNPDVTFKDIDPQLLPPGEPTFSTYVSKDQHSEFDQFPHNQILPGVDVGASLSLNTMTPQRQSSKRQTSKRTPKRKRSIDSVLDEYTPSRSSRKRKPTQRYLDSIEMKNN